eukprot:TRINITY_DN3183_c1_g1_i1.p1 TRINITY_DN3183_c1_g1~~TRINITY_DN3183_c1_g1_i1.p1  ORF type:complete len:405 (+),score=120.32 TRINITY_DN3183_c1_g1_i1:608-1822(+)
MIQRNPSFFGQFTAVIATQLSEESLAPLLPVLAEKNVPLLIARSYGLVGYVKIIVPEHTVVNAHPENATPDLRIFCPWPALQNYVDSFDMAHLDSAQHSHVPYIVILVKALQAWREQHGGTHPSTSKEKDEFKNAIMAASRNFGKEQNFQEAYAAAHRAWTAPCVPTSLQRIFGDPKCKTGMAAAEGEFWVVAQALRGFVLAEGRGAPPLAGALPDMTASTETFVELQQIYANKAEEDARAVAKRVEALLDALDPSIRARTPIPFDTVRSYCRNASHIRVINTAEYDATKCQSDSCALWYFAVRAADVFTADLRRVPGQYAEQAEGDLKELKRRLMALVPSCKGGDVADALQELCRYGGAELHTTAAAIGGIAAQEVVKLVTHHFVPLVGTLVYDGIHCTTTTL